MPAKGMELPAHVDERLREEFNCRPVPRQMYEADNAAINALYVTPDMPHQLSLIPSVEMDAPVDLKIRKKIDVMYVTRFQKERWAEASADYPRIDSNLLRESKYSDTAVLHPLPRVGELDVALDGDSRALYFHQASYGVPIRMALIGMLLQAGEKQGLERYPGGFPAPQRVLYDRPATIGVRCANTNCIVHDPLERDYTRNKFWLMEGGPAGAQRLRCVYCESNVDAHAVGNAKKREFALLSDAPVDRHHALPEHLIFFRDAGDAHSHGYTERSGREKRA
jgi:hypothetical protein